MYYDWQSVMIRYDVIENRLNLLRSLNYSNQLVGLIEVMLCPNEVNRPDIERTSAAVRAKGNVQGFSNPLNSDRGTARQSQQNYGYSGF